MSGDELDTPSLGRIVRPADYVRVLAAPMRLRSPHFAVHHLEGRPLPPKRRLPRAPGPGEPGAGGSAAGNDPPVAASLSTELSTAGAPLEGIAVEDPAVDRRVDLGETLVTMRGPRRWLGLVVPKKHAKRAVTRSLVKRQIRTIAAACADHLPPGLWVVRQRSPFDPKQYPSAASDALKDAARAELRALFERAVRGERDAPKPRRPHASASGPGSSASKNTAPAGAPGDPACAA